VMVSTEEHQKLLSELADVKLALVEEREKSVEDVVQRNPAVLPSLRGESAPPVPGTTSGEFAFLKHRLDTSTADRMMQTCSELRTLTPDNFRIFYLEHEQLRKLMPTPTTPEESAIWNAKVVSYIIFKTSREIRRKILDLPSDIQNDPAKLLSKLQQWCIPSQKRELWKIINAIFYCHQKKGEFVSSFVQRVEGLKVRAQTNKIGLPDLIWEFVLVNGLENDMHRAIMMSMDERTWEETAKSVAALNNAGDTDYKMNDSNQRRGKPQVFKRDKFKGSHHAFVTEGPDDDDNLDIENNVLDDEEDLGCDDNTYEDGDGDDANIDDMYYTSSHGRGFSRGGRRGRPHRGAGGRGPGRAYQQSNKSTAGSSSFSAPGGSFGGRSAASAPIMASAFRGRSSANRGGSASLGRTRLTCFGCGNFGHRVADCPNTVRTNHWQDHHDTEEVPQW